MKLVIIEPLNVERESLLSQAYSVLPQNSEIIYYDTRTEDTAELIERAKDAEIIIVANQALNEEVIASWPKLQLISVAFTGTDHIDMDICRRRGITVCNSAGYATDAVAELTFGLTLSLMRKLRESDQAARNEQTRQGLDGFELRGKNFGIIGMGAIGKRVTQIARAFGCQVYAHSHKHKQIVGVNYLPLDELLGCCDIVSLHLPLTDDTRNLLNADMLALMQPHALLINTARGAIVDNIALADALNNDKLAGAGIDVFETEPPLAADHPLLHAKNTILAPHIGFATAEAMEKRAQTVIENISCWLKGQPQNVID